MGRCFYFGCWNDSGHYLYALGGDSVGHSEQRSIELFSDKSDGTERWHIDGMLAPRRHQSTGAITCDWHMPERDERHAMNYSSECPQGQFLRHLLPNGFTAISWWDRNQGDKRGACNSTILLEGTHTTPEMLEALYAFFPQVAENLKKAGVQLIEVHESPASE